MICIIIRCRPRSPSYKVEGSEMQQAPLHMKWQFAQKPVNDDSVNFVIGGRGARTEESIQTYGKHFSCKHWSCFLLFFCFRSRGVVTGPPHLFIIFPPENPRGPKRKLSTTIKTKRFYQKHSSGFMKPKWLENTQIRKTFRKTCPKYMKKPYRLGRRWFLLKKYKVD